MKHRRYGKFDARNYILALSEAGCCRHCRNSNNNTCNGGNSFKPLWPVTFVIRICHRIIKAVGEKICAKNSSQSKFPIRIDKSSDSRIIIPALQIIEPCLLVVHITAIPQRIQLSKLAGRCKDLAPGIVIVVCALHAVGGFEAYYIALQVGDIVVDSPVVDQRERRAIGIGNEASEWSHSEHLRQRPA